MSASHYSADSELPGGLMEWGCLLGAQGGLQASLEIPVILHLRAPSTELAAGNTAPWW